MRPTGRPLARAITAAASATQRSKAGLPGGEPQQLRRLRYRVFGEPPQVFAGGPDAAHRTVHLGPGQEGPRPASSA
ncbi:hypothetical protein GCM10010286_60010 [Streptomyces toxytricini]|nr:hypothetical protein GCM10010286_60010 [Streptomyces toxytricini]